MNDRHGWTTSCHASAVTPAAILGSRKFLADVERNLTALEHLPTLTAWWAMDERL